MRTPVIAFASALLATTALGSTPARAAIDCASLPGVLASMGLANTTIDVAQPIAAGSYTPAGSRPITGLPAFCRVHGFISPVSGSTVGFEVWLPQAGWNNKLEMFGNGGYSSALDYTDMGAQLIRGYATLGTDTGHNGSDPDFAQGDPQSIIDWSWRAVHVSAVAAKDVILAFYGQSAVHSYFSGCSTGGQQALSEVERFPGDFDGVIAGDPGHNRTHLNAGFLWEYIKDHPYRQDNAPILPASKLPMITAAVLNACRAQNGGSNGGLPTDNFLADPRDCKFDPKALLCQGADQPTCLTAPQVQTVQAIYDGPHDPRTGHLIENGYVRGSEAATPPGWASYFQDFNGLNEPARTNFWKIWVFDNPNWDWWTFDFDRDMAFTDNKLASTVNAMNPNIAPFAAHGGKLIQYHGWADPVVPSLESINYYDRVMATLGVRYWLQELIMATLGSRFWDQDRSFELHSPWQNIAGFYRLFMVPGMGHCTGGPGPFVFGTTMQTALEQWVERGQAPASIVATKYVNDNASAGVSFTRPLCPYPQKAYLIGSNGADAGSFVCATDYKPHSTPIPAPEYLR